MVTFWSDSECYYLLICIVFLEVFISADNVIKFIRASVLHYAVHITYCNGLSLELELSLTYACGSTAGY